MKYKFEDIAINSTAKKLPEPIDNEHYIGLEHLDSGNLYVTRWGAETAPIGEKLLMKKGDVLFGKRRAYQKKVAIAPFDGIFSAHGMVLRPKEDVICKEFFPFFISSDYFLNEAIRISVGGLSPTINWKDLRVLEFELPSLEEQKVLADKLWAAYEVKESYKDLLAQTDKLLHAQFEKMFGDGSPQLKIKDTLQESFSGEWGKEDSDNSGVKVLRTTNFTNNGILDYSNIITRIIDEDKLNKKKLLRGDIILERSGGTSDNPVGRVVYFDAEGVYLCNNFTQVLRSNESVNSKYLFYNLYYYYQDNKSEVRSMGSQTTGIQNLSLTKYYEVEIPVPPMKKQLEFVSIAEQAEQTKASLNKGIEAIEAVIRSLIAEGTTKVLCEWRESGAR